jgi:photosystem II stability/assembly factor-like uncharacterized protein
VLNEPALQTPRAAGAAMLAVTRAGTRLVAAGERGIVLLSDDGGSSWRQARVPVQVTLTALRFADARTGWAVGHLGVVLKTEDGGASWHKQLDGVQAAALMARALRAGDDRQQKAAQRYEDEGPDKPFFDLDFSDARRGVVVGAYNLAFATSDGGASWVPLSSRLPNPKNLHLYSARFVNGSLFIAGEQGLLLKSADGGASFEALPSPYKGSFFGLLATRSGALLAYGLRGRALRSTDGGVNWDEVGTASAVSLNAGLELSDGRLVLLAQSGDLLLSRDDGRSFTRVVADGVPAAGLAPNTQGKLVLAGLRGMRRPAP